MEILFFLSSHLGFASTVDAVVCIPTDRWRQILRTGPLLIYIGGHLYYSLKYNLHNTTLIYLFFYKV